MKHNWNLQLVRIYDKGMLAYRAGVSLEDNPYNRGERGGTGISSPGGNLQAQRARYWADGWRKASAEGTINVLRQ